MTSRILAACSPGEVRVAVLRDNDLLDYAIWRPGAPDGVGDHYLGRVIARVPAMAGSFVKLGAVDGFLPDSECETSLSEGDTVPVRVTRAAQGGKGPRLTARLAPNAVVPAPGPGPLLELAELHRDASVLIDDPSVATRLKPALDERMHLVPRAFDDGVEEQVWALTRSEVEAANGARLLIHPTPALTAIDVDAGGAAASRQGKAASHVAANLAVLPELARQIRLRNLSGAILVDFAGLSARRRSTLAPGLRAALALDPLRPRLLGFTVLGLGELVRPRVHPPLHEMLEGPHAAGLAGLRQIAEHVAMHPHLVPALRAAPAVVSSLQADSVALGDLARRAGRALVLRSDPRLTPVGWMIETGDD